LGLNNLQLFGLFDVHEVMRKIVTFVPNKGWLVRDKV
jgi:hypothetical protein